MAENIENVQPTAEGNAVATEKKASGNRRRSGNASRPERRSNAVRQQREESPYEDRVVKVKRICKTVKGGRRMRLSALVVSGDKKGNFGYGAGKSLEVPEAIRKASEQAKNNLIHIERVEGDTIAHAVMGKFGATQVFLKPAKEGTGIIAGGAVRVVLELAGIRNIYSKIYGSKTPSNVIKATIDGIKKLKSREAK